MITTPPIEDAEAVLLRLALDAERCALATARRRVAKQQREIERLRGRVEHLTRQVPPRAPKPPSADERQLLPRFRGSR